MHKPFFSAFKLASKIYRIKQSIANSKIRQNVKFGDNAHSLVVEHDTHCNTRMFTAVYYINSTSVFCMYNVHCTYYTLSITARILFIFTSFA